jgi:Methyltransferase domain
VGYRYENGRRYHAYRDGSYLLPNDEAEQDRLDLHHHIFRLMLGGKLYRAPITTEPHRVLDFGTGTGIWAMDFADEHPSAFVIGIDLSPIQPNWIPPNCKFYVDDLESEWIYRPDEAFDYIHGRSMSGCIGDWGLLWRRIYANLKPGGWVEVQEFEGWIYSADDSELERAPYVKKWLELLDEASLKFGKKLNVAQEQKQHLIDTGFVNIRDDVYKVRFPSFSMKCLISELNRFQLDLGRKIPILKPSVYINESIWFYVSRHIHWLYSLVFSSGPWRNLKSLLLG